MPTKRLPARPNLEHLKRQARDLLDAQRAGAVDALQRIREFHPRWHQASDDEIRAARFPLADAYLALAREYGYASWVRLKTFVERELPPTDALPHHERIDDPLFRRAVALLDDGDADGLRAHLSDHPRIARQRVTFEGENYFAHPTLLEFVAENPIRHASLPPNVVEMAQIIIDAAGSEAQPSIDSTLALVCSGEVSRKLGVQIDLIDFLCDRGASTADAMLPALAHDEVGAVEALLRHGARVDLVVAAALGRVSDALRCMPAASPVDRHRALALAAQHGQAETVRLLLDAGEDPNRYNPIGCHAHSTPLHQAAIAGHLDVVRLLVERGARTDREDILFHATPLQWAEHGKQEAVARFLA